MGYPISLYAACAIAARVVDIGGPWPRGGALVIRLYRGKRTVLYEGVDLTRAAGVYDKKLRAGNGLRDGDLVLYVDGVQARAFHGGYNRTRW